MIVEMRTYTLGFGTAARYFELYRAQGQAIQWRILGEPLGYYVSEIGALNQVVHLWRYRSFEDRLERRSRLWADEAWTEFAAAVAPIIVAQESRLMLEAPVLGMACSASRSEK